MLPNGPPELLIRITVFAEDRKENQQVIYVNASCTCEIGTFTVGLRAIKEATSIIGGGVGIEIEGDGVDASEDFFFIANAVAVKVVDAVSSAISEGLWVGATVVIYIGLG